ncbi:MAG: hypothetical protein A2600_00885 [Candidatus Lambdaproteobacteria bacterium RIFOXYD1_FULL_56_27]|uniref:Glycosyl transferase family 1 domain-containing protein n=1 Tax=Candidatus Lambdaproteobacteria bacterium RIFOXYD2_FULL_56_26 TaxID=1817773 RepID=A0A1F6GQD2_9PROT|nr:MAG: hypothetical protein A2557_09635 [Candidatus Lambdaproteobacteria bacterium RIFOXYD2_FULL_56_26]OGH01297.1 MAG: hypothetical protein A2426_12835 [Candidatus Lambdaproteobacteria bacterium RIFOXYC1_FULL_56_13]OGH06837.1 MAG: hypothetical protein A2600_00885 [Candidatus Lambdaproteobacteria bacterium RIFOXYD1_FULL_56_27]
MRVQTELFWELVVMSLEKPQIALELSASCTFEPTGVSRYAQRLTLALAQCQEYRWLGLYRSSRFKKRSPLQSWFPGPTQAYAGPFRFGRGQLQLVHGLDGQLPGWSNPAMVVTFHDLAPWKITKESVASERFLATKTKQYTQALAQAAQVVSVSQTTKNDLVELFQLDPARITVIPLGLEESLLQKDPLGTQVLERHRLKPKGYLLYLGSLSKRKNLFRLVEGYAKSAARKSYRLVLAGELSWGIESLAQKVQDLGLERDLTLLPYLPEADLPALYQGAVGFLYPTLYEGFGLPVLESMAAGTPILVGNLGAAPETAGGHGVLCDPYEAESIAAGIDQLPAFGADRIEAARTHAQSYSWEKTAAATLALYGQVLGRRDR